MYGRFPAVLSASDEAGDRLLEIGTGKHSATAATIYREMDMRFWLEQAEAEVRESG